VTTVGGIRISHDEDEFYEKSTLAFGVSFDGELFHTTDVREVADRVARVAVESGRYRVVSLLERPGRTNYLCERRVLTEMWDGIERRSS
jgi:hypothetical protein